MELCCVTDPAAERVMGNIGKSLLSNICTREKEKEIKYRVRRKRK